MVRRVLPAVLLAALVAACAGALGFDLPLPVRVALYTAGVLFAGAQALYQQRYQPPQPYQPPPIEDFKKSCCWEI